MTDKEKFRAEIVRLAQLHLDMREAYKAVGNTSAAATENVLYGHDLSILSFIDSMQKESVNENLEQAIDTYLATYFGGEKEKRDWPFLKKMAIYFANWQKLYDMGLTEKAEMKTVSELFNSETDELKKYATEIAFMMLPSTCTQSYHDTNRVRIIDAVIYGANWQKEQMMKKALDAVVKIDAGGYPYVDTTIELYDYVKDMPLAKEGDKVKIFLIKE